MTETVSPKIGMAVIHLFCKVTPLADAEAITTAVQKAQAEGDQVVMASASANGVTLQKRWMTAMPILGETVSVTGASLRPVRRPRSGRQCATGTEVSAGEIVTTAL